MVLFIDEADRVARYRKHQQELWAAEQARQDSVNPNIN
jgi:hypothetical protein